MCVFLFFKCFVCVSSRYLVISISLCMFSSRWLLVHIHVYYTRFSSSSLYNEPVLIFLYQSLPLPLSFSFSLRFLNILIIKVITLPLHGVAKTFKFRHRSFGVLALEKQQSCMVFHLFSMLYYVRIEKSPHILIVIRFNVNRFQCYSMLIQKNIATIFSRSLEFCSWKMWT